MRVRTAFVSGLSLGIVGVVAVAVWAADREEKQEKATAALLRQAQHGKEEAASIDEIPAKVREALLKEAAGARIAKYSYQKEDGSEIYAAEWHVNGRSCSAAVTPDGALMQHDEEVPAKDVPPAVRKAFAKMFPDAEDVVFEKWVTVEYDVTATVKGEEREVIFNPAGQLLDNGESDETPEPAGKKPEKPGK